MISPRASTLFGALASLAFVAAAAPAGATCAAAVADGAERVPAPWKAALDALLRSAAEPGHPWSCSAGRVALEPTQGGMRLRVTRDGDDEVVRGVETPADVVPLGQALLASPLQAVLAEGAAEVAPAEAPPSPPSPPSRIASASPAEPSPAPPIALAREGSRKAPRLLLAAGLDARAVGGSGVAWEGLTASAGVPLGAWLPSLSLRWDSALFADGPSLDEVSVALSIQYRLSLGALELRAGPSLRGAAVLRDLPRPAGEQSQIQGRLGGVVSLAVPLLGVLHGVAWVDGEGVVVSRETTPPTATEGAAATPFPTFTLGGGVGVEMAL